MTAPTPQPPPALRWAEENLLLEPWSHLPGIMEASPGGGGKPDPAVTSVGPQTPTDWLYEAESTESPVSPAPHPRTDSPVEGKQARRPQSRTFDT